MARIVLSDGVETVVVETTDMEHAEAVSPDGTEYRLIRADHWRDEDGVDWFQAK